MSIRRTGRRSTPGHQRVFPFLTRRIALERRFKGLIVLGTLLVVALFLAIVPWGWYLTMSAATAAAGGAIGLAPSREAADQRWRSFRQLQIATTRPRVEQFYAEAAPEYRRLLRYAGMDPEHGLIRWANYDWVILFPSTIFEPDDRGRSYRLRPRTRSIWLRNVNMPKSAGGAAVFYVVPDGPGLAVAISGTSARPVESSRQTTNSWGFRGPEPDPEAPVRGMILGDSYMQGLFIGDDETPPECLRRHLERRLGTRVSILNTGVMGYSPEQYYHTMVEFIDRFRPHFVVVSLFANDFGGALQVVGDGKGDWRDGQYWLEKIAAVCRNHHCDLLVVPVPYRDCLLERRTSGNYPGQLFNRLSVPAVSLFDPFDDFIAAYLRILTDARRRGEPPPAHFPLFNGAIGDDHFSAEGARLWGRSVGDRVFLLLDYDRAGQAAPTNDRDRVGPAGARSS